jgi:hypothetical protein
MIMPQFTVPVIHTHMVPVPHINCAFAVRPQEKKEVVLKK